MGTTVKEKDLGVTIHADTNVSEQCGIMKIFTEFFFISFK